jgi:hypothetical protein
MMTAPRPNIPAFTSLRMAAVAAARQRVPDLLSYSFQ